MNLQKIGLFLKDLRKESGRTQEQLGKNSMFQDGRFPDGRPETTCLIWIC